MKKRKYSKSKIIDYVWQYSKYYGGLLVACEEISEKKDLNGHTKLICLFNILENVIKSQIHDYDAHFVNAIDKLKSENYINNIEHNFLNNKDYGIRKIRNLLTHANLSKYNIIFSFEDEKLLYPLTENETCIKFYDLTSKIIFNLMLKIISSNFSVSINVNIDKTIQNFKIKIEEISDEQLLKYKGIDYNTVKGWNEIPEIERYRIVENTSDVNHYIALFKMIDLKK